MNALVEMPDLDAIIAEAVLTFLAAGHQEGDTISHSTMRNYLHCLDPDEPGLDYQEGKARRVVYVDRFGRFKERLLRDYCIALTSDWGEGYRWLPAVDQAPHALAEAIATSRQAARKAAMVIKFTDLSRLDHTARQVRADNSARLDEMRRMLEKIEKPFWG